MSVATRKAIKTVQIIARVQFKSDARKVVYLVRASNGIDQYETYLFDGRALSCTCDSRKPCYHMRQVETKEGERVEVVERLSPLAAETPEYARYLGLDGTWYAYGEEIEEPYERVEIDDDAKYEAWKRDNSLDNTMSREAYVACFDPCGMEVR